MTLSPFDIARFAALKEYAELEYELCLLFRNLLGVESDVAGAIFYQISNTRTRYAIITSLIDINQGGRLKAWKKLETWLTPRDTARNHLTHWFEDRIVQVNMSGEGKSLKTESVTEIPNLRNPTRRWRSAVGQLSYKENGMWDERDKARVMKHIINRFGLTVERPEEWPWTDIFQQPATHQNPEAFLQHLNRAGHAALLPPYDR
jgi:hypothetical protein